MPELPIEQPLPVPEADMNRIATAIAEHKEAREGEPQVPHEAIRSTLQSLAGVTPPPQASPAAQAEPSLTLPDYLADAAPEIRKKVELLIETAQYKGIDAAHAEAKSAEPFILDAFHDVMTGKLYRAFKDRGLLR